jgi:hypothetical protein
MYTERKLNSDLNTMIRSWIYNLLVLIKKYIFRRKLDTLQRVQPIAGTKKNDRIYRIVQD